MTADLIHAHLTKPTIPSPRQVFDHYSSAVAWRGLISWDQEPPFAELVPVHSEAEALERATTASTSGDYLDVHCWMFTPSSFTRLFGALTRLHLVPFSLESCSETVGGEFFATLRVCDPATASAPPVEGDDGLLPTASEDAAVRAELRSGGPELKRVLASRSWQVTKPLRAANRQIARVRNRSRPPDTSRDVSGPGQRVTTMAATSAASLSSDIRVPNSLSAGDTPAAGFVQADRVGAAIRVGERVGDLHLPRHRRVLGLELDDLDDLCVEERAARTVRGTCRSARSSCRRSSARRRSGRFETCHPREDRRSGSHWSSRRAPSTAERPQDRGWLGTPWPEAPGCDGRTCRAHERRLGQWVSSGCEAP